MKKFLALLLLIFIFSLNAHADDQCFFHCEDPVPLLALGGGYFDSGKHSGWLVQAEYKWGKYFFRFIRPQAGIIIPKFQAVMIYVGIGLDLYLSQHIVFSPNFGPGLYFHGKNGKDLGYPLEFRSALEFAYEMDCKARLGFQFYHISNASLSCRNPGANAAVVFLALPLCLFRR